MPLDGPEPETIEIASGNIMRENEESGTVETVTDPTVKRIRQQQSKTTSSIVLNYDILQELLVRNSVICTGRHPNEMCSIYCDSGRDLAGSAHQAALADETVIYTKEGPKLTGMHVYDSLASRTRSIFTI